MSPTQGQLQRILQTQNVTGRLAPSPTGQLHLGHAFSLLVAWWHSRSQNGHVVLRIDDVDSDRASAHFTEQLILDLKWLGLDWDDVPRIASERASLHKNAVLQLLARRHAYPCVCSRTDVITALGAPQQGATEIRYPGTCRDKYSTVEQAERASNKPASVRFMTEAGQKHTVDQVFGRYEEDVAVTIGDFIIQRRSGDSAYQLAVVIDDDFDHVSEVIRGRDLLPSTLRQNMVARALDLAIPNYVHLPLICDHTGRRLAKRDNDLSLSALRNQGVSATQIVTWAARCANQYADAEQVTAQHIRERFVASRLTPGDIILPERVRSAFDQNSPITRASFQP